MHYAKDFDEYFKNLSTMVKDGKLQTPYDQGINSGVGPFKGLDSIVDAVEVWLFLFQPLILKIICSEDLIVLSKKSNILQDPDV